MSFQTAKQLATEAARLLGDASTTREGLCELAHAIAAMCEALESFQKTVKTDFTHIRIHQK